MSDTPLPLPSPPTREPWASPSPEASRDSSTVLADQDVILVPNPPRAGEMSMGWRIITISMWIGVFASFVGVWGASEQLGLLTWWLGPRAQPQPRFVQISPFYFPLIMVLGIVNQVRWMALAGVCAGAILAAYGFGDLDRVTRLGLVEILIGAAAAAVSLTALTGTYRTSNRCPPPTHPDEPLR